MPDWSYWEWLGAAVVLWIVLTAVLVLACFAYDAWKERRATPNPRSERPYVRIISVPFDQDER